MQNQFNTFFTTTLSNALKDLNEANKPQWGSMTAKQMLIHLTQGSKMMHLEGIKLVVKEKHIEKAIAFLYSEKPINKGIEIPKDIGYDFNDGITKDIEVLKTELINATNIMYAFFINNPDFKAIHPYFGNLSAEQWLLFQKKHFTHHLSQFRLL